MSIRSLTGVAFVLLFVVVGVVVWLGSEAASGTQSLKSGVPGNYCLNGTGGAAGLAGCNGSNAQAWIVTQFGTVKNTAPSTAVCLDPRGGGKSVNTIVDIIACDSKPSQSWDRTGSLIKSSYASGLCLADPGNDPTSALKLETCNSKLQSQQWSAVSIAPPPPPAPTQASCGINWNGHASPSVAQCVGKIRAAAIWNLNTTTYVSCGKAGQPCGESLTNWQCLDALWNHESTWEWFAQNPTSPAYGIPQADPGSKMSSAGSDWHDDAATQIKWGLSYIKGTYGNPCKAWIQEQAVNAYIIPADE